MRFGICLPSHWPDPHPGRVHDAIEETAKAAAALGYDSVWTNDHVVAPAHHINVGHTVDPFVTLASLIHLVPTVALGTSVLVLPQRHALVVAKQAATLSVLSGGRLVLGVGVGWQAEEFQFLNTDFAKRSRITDEALVVLQKLWRDTPATFEGQFYAFEDAVMEPKPLDKRIPLWIGGNSAAAIRRAARFGDAWIPFQIDGEAFRAGVAELRAQTPNRAMPLLAAHQRIHIAADADPTTARLAGSPDTIVSQIVQYQQAGLDYLVCDFVAESTADLVRQAQIMCEQIVPHLKP